MNHALGVGGRKSGTNLLNNIERLVGRKFATLDLL